MQSFHPPPLTPAERRRLLAMRRWRPEERRIVQRGLLGRAAIAVEPALIALCFAVFTILIMQHGVRSLGQDVQDNRIIAVIFAPGAVAFAIYAVCLLVEPIRALRQTFAPIFIVDGYMRTRGPDDFADRNCTGYVAVLTDDKRVVCEWPVRGRGELHYAVAPALLEFSEYGGIHAIDGRPTGVLPRDFRNMGVGSNAPPTNGG